MLRTSQMTLVKCDEYFGTKLVWVCFFFFFSFFAYSPPPFSVGDTYKKYKIKSKDHLYIHADCNPIQVSRFYSTP